MIQKHSKLKFYAFLIVFGISVLSTAASAQQDGFQTPSFNGDVTSTALQPDSKILIGGTFTNVAGQTRWLLARLNSNGTLDASFQNPLVSPNIVRCIEVQSDGKILIGGSFTSVGGQPRTNIARINADGTLDSSFNSSVNGILYTLKEIDGKILIAGDFTTVGGQPRSAIARLNSDGALDSTFQNPLVTSQLGTPILRDIAIQNDGKILIGGPFNSVGGLVRTCLARLNSDGTLDSSLQDVMLSGGVQVTYVGSIAIQPNHQIVVGGDFSSINSQPRNATARLNPDGTLDSSFQNTTIMAGISNGFLSRIKLQLDGRILIGGFFDFVGGQARSKVARLNSDGTLDLNFNDPMVNGGQVFTIESQPDGKILLAGSFVNVGGRVRPRVTRLTMNGNLENPAPMTFTVTKTADTNDGVCNVDCSLREAIAAANLSDSHDTITFDPSFYSTPRTITLITGQLAVCNNGNLNINGPGPHLLTVSGNNQFRILRLFLGPSVVINDIRLSNGTTTSGDFSGCPSSNDFSYGGAAIENRAETTLNNVVISNSSVTGSGGGISNVAATLNLNRCVIEGNQATSGAGGIINVGIFGAMGGTLTIADSNIRNNTTLAPTSSGGGALLNFDFGTTNVYRSSMTNNATGSNGGAIASSKANISIINSTISSNQAKLGGAVYLAGGSASFENATLAFNNSTESGGGIEIRSFNGPTVVNLSNSILAKNVAPIGPNGAGGFTSNGFNIIGNTASMQIGGSSTGNQLNTDPLLDSVLRNVGTNSYYHELLGASPAIDSGSSLAQVVSDQRGKHRPTDLSDYINTPGGNGSDIGAFEIQIKNTIFDFDGDGKTDLSIFRPSGASGAEWWWLKSSTGGNGAVQFGQSTDRLAPVDFTGDGKTDVAFWRPASGEWFVLRSEDFSFYAFPFGATGDVPAPADYDGDGKGDAAVFRESTLTWYINKSNGGTDIVRFGAAGDRPVNADYDGDGKSDIAIFRPNGASGAEWWIRRSSDAGVFALQFGVATDNAVAGDYTGDGKADIAFWRPSTGFWNVLRSEDLSYYAFPFGANGDLAVPGDYDGDGKLDAAVFRPSASTWFANRSTAGVLIQQFGIAGDVPVPNTFVR